MSTETQPDTPELLPVDAPMERKSFAFDLKLADLTDDGQFSGYAAVFGNVDLDGDVIEPGAFRKTIRESRGEVPILWQHNPGEPIGVSLELEEDDRGLYARGQLVLRGRGEEAYAHLKARSLRGLSIGYQTVKQTLDRHEGVRRLKELKLWEFSLVTFPANPLAVVTGVKSDQLVRELSSLAGEVRMLKALLAAEPATATRPDDGAAAATEEPALATLRVLTALTADIQQTMEVAR